VEILDIPVVQVAEQWDVDKVRVSLTSENCPAELLFKVINLPHVSDDVWRSLSHHSVWSVRGSVANNLRCPVDVLVVLSKDSHSSVRGMVASHPCCPVDVVAELVQDRNWGVRMAALSQVGMDDTYSPDELVELARVGDATTRLLVMKHPHCSSEVLMSIWEICKDDADAVSVCRSLAGHALAPSGLLREAAEHPIDHVRWAVAHNEVSPEDALERLAYDEVLPIRAVAVSNRHCPTHVLGQHIVDPLSAEEEFLYTLALNNPNSPSSIWVS